MRAKNGKAPMVIGTNRRRAAQGGADDQAGQRNQRDQHHHKRQRTPQIDHRTQRTVEPWQRELPTRAA